MYCITLYGIRIKIILVGIVKVTDEVVKEEQKAVEDENDLVEVEAELEEVEKIAGVEEAVEVEAIEAEREVVGMGM